jgi:UDP-N-acetylmuramoyl-L-alanyl-D-glutamate--2,6-diaminopimelate ligase
MLVALDHLIAHLSSDASVTGPRSAVIESLTTDSRNASPSSLFVALRGEHTDGHRFIGQAIGNGAAAVVAEAPFDAPAGVAQIVVPDSAKALSQLADAFFGSPSRSLAIAGVTGTNGKTTTTRMIASIFDAAGVQCATIGTIGARFGAREWELANTTPLAPELQSLLAQLRDLGAKAVAMEVSSHGLALHRVDDVRFAVAALTNVTRDHLDFHKSFESYAAAKRRLFDLAPRCVLNADDDLGERWARELRPRKPMLTYALRCPADLRPSEVEVRSDGSRFQLDGTRYDVRIPGRFNVANALCAIGVSRQLDVSPRDAAEGLARLEQVSGRMQFVRGSEVDAVVDYAHTPDALENVLTALRETARGRVLVVFGCGGDRDRGKRPLMGAVAARYADFTYVTSDNPRTEDPQSIVDEILNGVNGAPHTVLLDRRRAIGAAIADARAGDLVLIAGKGHERYQIVGRDVLDFDDAAVAHEALARREAAHR